MIAKATACFGDQAFVEPLLRHPRLVARHKDDSLARGIECERHAPYAVSGGKAQFLHVGIGRALKRIGVRPAQKRPLKLEQRCCGNARILHFKRQPRIFWLERLMEHDLPLPDAI